MSITIATIGKYTFSPPAFMYAVMRRMMCPFAAIAKYLSNAGAVADIGCGHGVLTIYLALAQKERNVTGWDPDASRVAIGQRAAQGMENVNFVQGQFQADANSIEGAVVSDVLHHMSREQQEDCVRLIHESLSPGGVFVVKEICTDDGYRFSISSWTDRTLYPDQPCSFRSKSEWEDLLLSSGFASVDFTRIGGPLSTNLFVASKK